MSERPLQRGAVDSLGIGDRCIKVLELVLDDLEVLVLSEGVEGQPEAEAIGQGDLLLDPFALVDLAVDDLCLTVLALEFGQQMAAVRRGAD